MVWFIHIIIHRIFQYLAWKLISNQTTSIPPVIYKVYFWAFSHVYYTCTFSKYVCKSFPLNGWRCNCTFLLCELSFRTWNQWLTYFILLTSSFPPEFKIQFRFSLFFRLFRLFLKKSRILWKFLVIREFVIFLTPYQ